MLFSTNEYFFRQTKNVCKNAQKFTDTNHIINQKKNLVFLSLVVVAHISKNSFKSRSITVQKDFF